MVMGAGARWGGRAPAGEERCTDAARILPDGSLFALCSGRQPRCRTEGPMARTGSRRLAGTSDRAVRAGRI